MKKVIYVILLGFMFIGCKTSKHHCDAYSIYDDVEHNDDIDINIIESQKKFVTSQTIKLK